jgi:hypothetical protein
VGNLGLCFGRNECNALRRSRTEVHRERGIRQRRVREHTKSDEDFRRNVEDCYINPVKHGFVGASTATCGRN